MENNHIIKVFFEDNSEPLELGADIVNMSELLKELSVFTSAPVQLVANSDPTSPQLRHIQAIPLILPHQQLQE
jgi:hypothetical protein